MTEKPPAYTPKKYRSPRLQPVWKRNAELQAALLALVGECQDLALAAGLYNHKWEEYPPALRNARRLLGLQYMGPIKDTDIDPLIEVTITMNEEPSEGS